MLDEKRLHLEYINLLKILLWYGKYKNKYTYAGLAKMTGISVKDLKLVFKDPSRQASNRVHKVANSLAINTQLIWLILTREIFNKK